MNKKPNFLIFMADHYRGDMAPPFEKCLTPNLDDIYNDGGTAFTNCFCPSPHCCPSRATFHTGLYPSEHGVWNNVMVGNTLSRGLNDGISTWSVPIEKEAGGPHQHKYLKYLLNCLLETIYWSVYWTGSTGMRV